MTLTLQAMTKIIYIPEFQNLTLLPYKTQHYKQKTILLSTNRPLKPHKILFLQQMYKQTYHLLHIVHRLYLSMIHHFSSAKTIIEVSSFQMTTHERMFLHDTPKDWAFQVHMYAYAHNSQPLSELSISPHEIVFHTRTRIPLTFDLNPNRDTSKTCISRYCSQLPEHSHYDKSDLNPFFIEHFQNPFHIGFSP